MNIWQDLTIPALVFASGCLALAIWALSEREQFGKRNVKLQLQNNELTQERDEYLAKLEELMDVSAKILEASQKTLEERNTLKLQLDEALKPKPARTPRSNSKAKQPE